MFPSRRIATMGSDVFRDEYSLEFDGTNDYVDLGTTPVTTNHSIVGWVKILETQHQELYLIQEMQTMMV